MLKFLLFILLVSCFGEKSKKESLLEQNQKYWDILAEYDLKNKSIGNQLKSVVGKDFRIYGFIVPLQYDENNIEEFLLIPYPLSCLHLPPPEINQMIVAKMLKKKAKYTWGPIWVRGLLQINPSKDQQAEQPLYSMEVIDIEPYEDQDGSLQEHITAPE